MLRRLLQLDTFAGGIATAAIWMGQLAVVVLGAHLVADRIDDSIAGYLLRWLPLTWGEAYAQPIGTVVATLVEIAVAIWALRALVRARQAQPTVSMQHWRLRVTADAMVSLVAWLPLSLAGSWMIGMAVEDSLASWLTGCVSEGLEHSLGHTAITNVVSWIGPDVDPIALALAIAECVGRLAALLAVWRLAWSGWWDVLTHPPAVSRRTEGLIWAPIALGAAFLAAQHGLPLWGLL